MGIMGKASERAGGEFTAMNVEYWKEGNMSNL